MQVRGKPRRALGNHAPAVARLIVAGRTIGIEPLLACLHEGLVDLARIASDVLVVDDTGEVALVLVKTSPRDGSFDRTMARRTVAEPRAANLGVVSALPAHVGEDRDRRLP